MTDSDKVQPKLTPYFPEVPLDALRQAIADRQVIEGYVIMRFSSPARASYEERWYLTPTFITIAGDSYPAFKVETPYEVFYFNQEGSWKK